MVIGRWSGRMSWLAWALVAVLIGGGLLAGCSGPTERQSGDPATRAWAEIVPESGAETLYGMPLAMASAGQFIDWYYSIQLSSKELAIRDAALRVIAAPCCDDYPMSRC